MVGRSVVAHGSCRFPLLSFTRSARLAEQINFWNRSRDLPLPGVAQVRRTPTSFSQAWCPVRPAMARTAPSRHPRPLTRHLHLQSRALRHERAPQQVWVVSGVAVTVGADADEVAYESRALLVDRAAWSARGRSTADGTSADGSGHPR
jgi:hypothetical protein